MGDEEKGFGTGNDRVVKRVEEGREGEAYIVREEREDIKSCVCGNHESRVTQNNNRHANGKTIALT